MSHDNVRFNVSGDSIEGLAATLDLWGLLHGHSRYNTNMSRLNFTGYSLHPNYGMVLHIYDGDDKIKTPFPFNEGKDAKQLANFFYSYLNSDKSNVTSVLEEKGYMSEEERKALIADFSWDEDADHDGSNERHWRVMTGRWGHVLSYSAPLAIRPAYCWYGK